MEINSRVLEEKANELLQIASHSSLENRSLYLDKIRVLTEIQVSYQQLCQQFETNFILDDNSVLITITEGAVRQSYINLKAAVNSHLVDIGKEFSVSFVDLNLTDFKSKINDKKFLKDRSIAKMFYNRFPDGAVGKRFRFTKVDNSKYTIEALY